MEILRVIKFTLGDNWRDRIGTIVNIQGFVVLIFAAYTFFGDLNYNELFFNAAVEKPISNESEVNIIQKSSDLTNVGRNTNNDIEKIGSNVYSMFNPIYLYTEFWNCDSTEYWSCTAETRAIIDKYIEVTPFMTMKYYEEKIPYYSEMSSKIKNSLTDTGNITKKDRQPDSFFVTFGKALMLAIIACFILYPTIFFFTIDFILLFRGYTLPYSDLI